MYNIESYIYNSKNTNTKKSTGNWMRVFSTWAGVRDIHVKIEEVDPNVLDLILQRFYTEVKKQNGDDYEPNSLANMQAAIGRYLKDKGYKHSIIRYVCNK